MIITITGQYGSGGEQIGRRLAEILNYRVLDSELVIRAREIYAATYGNTDKPIWWPSRHDTLFYHADDIPNLSVAYKQAEFALQTDLIFSDMSYLEELGPEADDIRKAMLDAQTKAILEYAETRNCILFGKCSNFVLRDRPDAIHAFATADLDVRITRIMNLYNVLSDDKRGGKKRSSLLYSILSKKMVNMDREAARDLIYTTDKRRATCHEFITGEKWGDPKKFDFLISGNNLDLEEETERFLQYIREHGSSNINLY